ncbi:UNVERIFIED_CONTAM: Retrovirus-related Pol polyprotein from transposon RE2 [Sesamum radiatum]|uniref:Retrovirus-related Pol polyprotein from transposon RE2 n=1 Tax=Sesamum radiatum TaxID=300843 RepID=A0AAW2LN82_SESRA
MAGEGATVDFAQPVTAQMESNDATTHSSAISITQTDMEDLEIHTSDHPGMILVSDPLVRNNYLLWSRAVKVALTAKMKLSFINGTYPKPAAGTENFKQWVRTDSMVFSWIMNCISKDISKAFYYAKLARRLWLDLESRFGQSNGPMIYNLQREIASVSQGNLDVVAYYTKLKMLWDELECIDPTPDCECSSQRTGQINMEEANPNAALLAKNVDIRQGTGNFQRRKSVIDKKNLFCDHCSKSGHSRDACFKLHGYPEWFKEYSEQKKNRSGDAKALAASCELNKPRKADTATTESISHMLTEVLHLMKGKMPTDQNTGHFASIGDFAGTYLNSTSSFFSSHSWIIDSGATAHMCTNVQLLHNLAPLPYTSSVSLPDGSKQVITHCGNVTLSDHISLTHVLHIPHFKYNLLSVSKLISSSRITFVFLSSQCLLQDQRTKKVLAVGKLVGKLYVLDTESFSKEVLNKHTMNIVNECSLNVTITENDLWHRRLGYTPILVLKHANVLKEHCDDLSTCHTCPLAKQQRLPFLISATHSMHIFELLHVDIWGPYNQFSFSGCTYLLTVVDDFSRATWVFLMRYKSQSVSTLQHFYSMVLTQFDRKLKVVRTDNGSEFLSEKCQSFFLDKGIMHHKTCPYPPQQNGVVERKHKHLLQIARAVSIRLAPRFWTEAILIATFIINRLPTSVLQWRSPYEVLYNKPVDYFVLKVFGCLAFATNLQLHKTKFTKRAHRCVFVGYVPRQKEYKLFDLDDKVMLVSRDIVFHERIFPFQGLTDMVDRVPCSAPLLDDTERDDTESPTTSTTQSYH